MAAMVDQVTSGGIERSMGDMLLEQVAEAEKNYREELEIMVANLSRLSGELRALVQEPRGDREGARRPSERDRRDREKDQRKANGHRHAERRIKARNLVYDTQMKLLTELLAAWTKIIKNAADKIGR
jgi:hypothetical protein